MAITIELAEQVVNAHKAANRPVGTVEFISSMWSERQAKEMLAELKRFRKAPEPTPKKQEPATAKKPTEPTDAIQLTAMEFRHFIERVPREQLEGLPKYMVTAVGLVMSNHCDYATGTKMHLTTKALSDLSGVTRPSVQRVLSLLERKGAITKTGSLPHPGGRSSKTYRLSRSDWVNEILDDSTSASNS